MDFIYSDGGRAASGFKGEVGDCAVRSIAIATRRPYKDVYDAVNLLSKSERVGKMKRSKFSARNGVYRTTITKYLATLGWVWVPTMFIGSGCTVRLYDNELPLSRLVVRLSKHITCVIDGTIYDTYDPQRNSSWIKVVNGVKSRGTSRRCVYGYWIEKRDKLG